MARETITRGHPALAEHDARPGQGITGLRPTWRGVSVALVAIILLAVALSTGDSTLFLVLVAVALPFAIAPVVVLARASRAAGVEIHMMVTPPLVPVGAPCSLLVQLSQFGRSRPPSVGSRPTVGPLECGSLQRRDLRPDRYHLASRWPATSAA